MYCTKCGQNNIEGTNFCSWCGSPMASQTGGGSGSLPARDLGGLVGHTFFVYLQNFWPFVLIALPVGLLNLVSYFAAPELSVETFVLFLVIFLAVFLLVFLDLDFAFTSASSTLESLSFRGAGRGGRSGSTAPGRMP